jgi:hypothetical protein
MSQNNTHKTSFAITDAKLFLSEMVLPQYSDFTANNSSSRHALLTTILCYHICEWVNPKTYTLNRFNIRYPNHPDIGQYLDIARQITNGTKHFKEKPSDPVETFTKGGFSSEFSDAFARPLIIKTAKEELSADKFLRKLVEFWRSEITV